MAGAALLPQLRHLVPSQPTLIIEEGRQQGERIDLPEGELLLGRVGSEGFALDDGRVSRRHAMVRRSGDYVEIADLASRNGIRVNGVDVRSRQLFPGDRVEIGDTILRLEGPPQVVAQIPAQALPVSPVRGAFGDVEVSRPPQRQAAPGSLAEAPFTETRQQVLGRLAPLLAARPGNPESLRLDAVQIVAEALGADHRIVIKVKDNEPVFEAATAQQAQLLSGTLPAVERALPGQLSLSTTVRVNIDDRWAVVVAPILEQGRTTALAVLVKRIGRFDTDALAILEATCGLLGLRANAR
jgi:pSer/pThr/pTyr-binding forkhead associated (FHA) protein